MHCNAEGVPRDIVRCDLWLERAADDGSVDGLLHDGILHESSSGGLQDYTKAVIRYRAAAERGSREAQERLARMYASGKGVAKNDAEANRWLHMASGGRH